MKLTYDLIMLLFYSVYSNAQNFWQPIYGIYGGEVFALAVNSSDDIFAGSKVGVFRSTDNGDHWTTINNGLPNISITSLSVSPNGYIFTGTSGGVFRSIHSTNSLVEEIQETPINFLLSQNYPNPFNPSTTIGWQSPVGSHQTIKVFDVLGNEVATLVDEYKPAGKYEVKFSIHSDEGRKLSSGVYFYKLQAGEYTAVKKMILLR